MDRRRLERTIDEAQRLGLCEERQLRAAVERNPGRIGGGRLAVLLDEHAAGSTATANDFEELFLALCRERHLPPPEVNAWVGPYKPDFLWRSQRVIVETDGRGTHGTRRAFESDRSRGVELTSDGWRVLRFTWRQLTGHPEWVARKVGEVVGG